MEIQQKTVTIHAQPARPSIAPHPPARAKLRTKRKAGYRKKHSVLRAWRNLFCGVLLVLLGIWMLHSRSAVLSDDYSQLTAVMGKAEEITLSEEAETAILSLSEPAPYALHTAPPYTVMVDAGHGGMDTGAGGIKDEYLMTQATVDFLMSWLENDANFKAYSTHAEGENPSIADRAQLSKDRQSDLTLSIHGNSDTAKSSYGFECFATPPGRLYNAQSLLFAHHVAQRMGEAGARLRGGTGVRYLYYVTRANGKTSKLVVDETDTTVRQDVTFGIVEKVHCPSLLIEQCFITNSSDFYKWATEEGCAKAARIYYEAICAYFDTEPVTS